MITDGTPFWADVDVEDLDATTAFYGELLGWTFTEGIAPHHRAVALSNGVAVAGLGSPGAAAAPAWTLYFSVDDADDAVARAEELGAMLLLGPEDDGRDGRLFVAVDTGGAVFGGWEADPDGPPALRWVDAASAEPGQSRSFYAGLFGWDHAADDVPGYTTFGSPPRGGIGFAGDALPHWLVHFAVPDAEEAVAIARRNGGTVVEPVIDTGRGRRAVVTDPAGARFAVLETRSGAL